MLRNAAAGLLLACGIVLLLLFCLGFRPRHIRAMFSHPVAGGTGTGAPGAPGGTETRSRHSAPRAFGTANTVVLAAYLGAMLAIGAGVGRKITTTRGFFLAGGRMHYLLVGLSLLGTYLSALTMMGLPGMAYGKHDWTYMVQLPFLVVTAMVITGLVLPRYRAAGVVSVYAFLEQRIHLWARLLASACFVVFAVARMGLVLYLPALAFSTVTGFSLPLCILVMGIIITVYTVLGGMEAVIWTDAVQVVIFIAGALLTLGYIFHDLGAEQFVRVGLAYNKFRIVVPSLDLTRITSLWLVLETVFQTIRIYGTQQDMAQRYLAAPDTRRANRSVWVAILAYIPLGFVFYFIGTALFVFYRVHPAAALPGKADPMYPHFIVNHLPAGIAGLVIAAVFAAAMSSIDSLMNSASAVCVEDFYKRLGGGKEAGEAACLRLARGLTVLWGAAAVLMGFAFMRIEYAQIVWGKVMGVSTNGMLGLMALAFLPRRVGKWAAVTGFAASYACLFLVMFATRLNFLLWPVVGNLTCFLVALGVDRLFPEAGKR